MLAFFSCFFAWPFTARFGRRWSLVLSAMVFNVGAAIQLIPNRGLAPWYAGRVISGVGVGLATVIIPMYSAEMAPKRIRGSLGSMFQFFFTLGVMTSYWIDYAVAEHVQSSTRQWQIPVGLQLVPGGLLALGMLYPKESARWLAKMERVDDAMASLVWVRGGESPEVQEEYAAIIPFLRTTIADSPPSGCPRSSPALKRRSASLTASPGRSSSYPPTANV